MPRDEYYRRLGVAIGKLGNRLLRKGDEYDSLCRKHEDFGRKDEAMDAFFMYVAYDTAHYGMIKRFEEIRDKTLGDRPKFFTLTAEDISTIKLMSFLSFEYLDMRMQYNLNTKEECQEDVDKINELLTRIKQWQDGNKRLGKELSAVSIV